MTLSRLKDPLFIASLSLLLLNDLALKDEFGNWITGKLSDLCGLFIFPFFWSVIFPAHRKPVHVFTALVFILWKSPFSEPLIRLSDHFYLPLDRVVDYSDLLTLPIILFSYSYVQEENFPRMPVPVTLICLTALFAFSATSRARMPKLDYVNLEQDYIFPFPLKELGNRMNRDLRYHAKKMMRYTDQYYFDSLCNCYLDKCGPDTLVKFLDMKNPQTHDTIQVVSFLAKMKIVGYGDSSALILDEIHTWAPANTDTVKFKKDMLRTFNKLIVKRLRKD